MGRKIPARKHHGVKDPIKQNLQRLSLIKDAIDHPPEKEDSQKVSHKFAEFIKQKTNFKFGTKNKKEKIVEDKPENYSTKKWFSSIRNNKELPSIRRYQNESDDDYLRRVNRVTRESIQESKFENKYGVEVVRNSKTGEINVKKLPKDEFAEQLKNRQKEIAQKYKKTVTKITPTERRKLVAAMMAKKKEEKKEEKKSSILSEFKVENIRFGEVVHEPPQLTAPRKASKAATVPRPGKKKLILHDVICGTVADVREAALANKKPKLPCFDLKGKRKAMPNAVRQIIDKDQKEVIELYRQSKKKNRATDSR